MPLEATMICLDNSDFLRNGDYPPSRLEQLSDAVNILSNAKTNQNPENTVGLLTMAERVKLRTALTPDVGKILNAMHQVTIGGESDLITGVQVAALGLRHRQNKNQKQRVIVFFASPLPASLSGEDLVKLGKKLKKSKVAVDVVSFGEEENIPRLQGFVEAVNSGDNSHFVHVPAGGAMVSDFLLSTPILAGDDGDVPEAGGGSGAGGAGMAGGAGGMGAAGFGMGGDGDMDPEMMMAIQMSIREEEERQARAAGAGADAGADSSTSTSTPAPATAGAGGGGGTTTQDLAATLAAGVDGVAGDEAALLAQAIAMSMAEGEEEDEDDEEEDEDEDEDEDMDAIDMRDGGDINVGDLAADYMDLDDDAQMELAMQMSMAESGQGQARESETASTAARAPMPAPAPASGGSAEADLMADPDFLQSVLSTLPGVDVNDVLSSVPGLRQRAKEEKGGEEGEASGSSDPKMDAGKPKPNPDGGKKDE